MLIFMIPARYRPIALIIGGIAGLIAGFATGSRLLIVVGGAAIVWGGIRGVTRRQHPTDDRDGDRRRSR